MLICSWSHMRGKSSKELSTDECFAEEKERGCSRHQEDEGGLAEGEDGGGDPQGQEICTKVQQRHKGEEVSYVIASSKHLTIRSILT